ncbi:MAG: NTP transferase domain-containing protein [Armatimonadetes bacterium]|nr:NTP transferase domain-containing protein [Armatimonadota bacterium]
MKGVVLAAGKGTRLFPVTRAVAKPLLPIANRMTIQYAFDQFGRCGISDVCVVVGESEEQMRDALGDGSRFGVDLTYVRQTTPKGLAHAVGFAREFVGDDDFMLYLGDAVYGESLAPFAAQFQEQGAANLNLVKAVDDPKRFGVATVEDGRIVKLVEKPAEPESNLAMAGMYIFGPQIWPCIDRLEPSARGEYEITDAIQLLVESGALVIPGVYDGEWFDTGTLDSFLETSRFLTDGGVLVGDGATVSAQMAAGVVIGSGATVVANRIENSVILPDADVHVTGDIRGCLLGGRINADQLENTIRYGEMLE